MLSDLVLISFFGQLSVLDVVRMLQDPGTSLAYLYCLNPGQDPSGLTSLLHKCPKNVLIFMSKDRIRIRRNYADRFFVNYSSIRTRDLGTAEDGWIMFRLLYLNARAGS